MVATFFKHENLKKTSVHEKGTSPPPRDGKSFTLIPSCDNLLKDETTA